MAFICVHNSCRSQIAEALGKHLASEVFESFSAEHLMIIEGWKTLPENQTKNLRLSLKRLKTRY